jgi:hypothetical protein
MMANPKYRVEGLTLPREGLIRDQTFANNIALYLQGSPSNLDKAQNVLNIFCQASEAKINWHKSAVIWANKKEKDWEWGKGEGLKWILDGDGTRYFGI